MKVNEVAPLLPSGLVADTGAIDTTDRSSFTIVPLADAVPSVRPAEALDRVSANVSSNSTAVSPETVTVTIWLVWPGAKVSDPDGRLPPKSAALAP